MLDNSWNERIHEVRAGAWQRQEIGRLSTRATRSSGSITINEP